MIDKNDPRLTAYIMGELDESEMRALTQAIAADAELQSIVDEIRETVGQLNAAYKSEGKVALHDGQRAVLHDMVAETGHVQTRPISIAERRFYHESLFYWTLAIAASLLLLLIPLGVFHGGLPEKSTVALSGEITPAPEKQDEENAFFSRKQSSDDSKRLSPRETENNVALGGVMGPGGDSEDPTTIDEVEVEELPDVESRFNSNSFEKLAEQSERNKPEFANRAGGVAGLNTNTDLDSLTPHLIVEDESRPMAAGEDGSANLGLFGDPDTTRLADAGELRPALPARDGTEVELGMAWKDTGLPINQPTEPDGESRFRRESDFALTVPTDMPRPTVTADDGQIPGQLDNPKSIDGFGETGKNQLAQVPRTLDQRTMEADTTETLPPPADKFYFHGRYTNEDFKKIVPQFLKRVDPSGTKEIIKLEAVPELGSVILRGDPEDVEEVEKMIKEFTDEDSSSEGKQIADQLRLQIGNEVKKHNEAVRRKAATTWKRVKAIPNTSRLMVGDKDELEMNGMQVNVQVDGFRARVLIDCFYYNHHPRQLEGTFKLRLPDDASLYYFAFGQSAYEYRQEGKLAAEEFLPASEQFVSLRPADIGRARQNGWQHVKEARLVTREKAAHAYSETVRRKVDPALVEWSGAGVFNAKVFPLMPNKLHRIVIGYDVDLTQSDGSLVYNLDLPESTSECKVNLNVLEMEGVEYKITPDIAPVENLARVERLNQGKADEIRRLSEQRQQLLTRLGKEHPQVLEIDKQIDAVSDARNNALAAAGEVRQLESRYHFDNPAAKSIRLELTNAESTMLRSDDANEGSFWATRISPELPRVAAAANDRAVFLVDTSLSSQPDKFNLWLELLQATLNNNRDTLKKFSVLFFNIESHFWQDGYSDNTEENVNRLIDHCQQLALEGATDVYGAIERVAKADWIKQDDKNPDLFLLSDGAANWGETNLRLINRLVAESNFGSLFAYQSSLNGTAIGNLRFIADESGGAVFSVTSEAEIQQASTAHRQRPWRVSDMTVEGATDVMTAGRVQWIYPGQSLTLVGRIEKDGAEPVQLGKLVLHLEQDGNKQAIEIESKRTVETDLASRLYGQVAVGQLESLGESVFDVAAAYARHFRITGQTCSLLMLESEADYQRFDIKPEEDLFVIKSKDADQLIDKTLQDKAAELADPKQKLLTWLTRLESQPGIQFKMPTALKLAMDDMQIVAISKSLEGGPTFRDSLPKEYLQMLLQDHLDYQIIKKEADRRLLNRDDQAGSPTDEALKVMSSLVEKNPGDLVLARDVAFSAMELHRPAQAYHLLRRVALARPYESSIYLALGQCLTQLERADMAIVFYEVAVNSSFQNRSADYTKIVASEYSQLLRQIIAGKQKSDVKEFAKARLASLTEKLDLAPCDLVVTMMWNTDQTDIDLHIVEPSGEECFYQHKDTRSGGHLTQDITDGFGPEMYTLPNAPKGDYKLLVKYYAGNQNRTDLRSKVYLTIHRNFGRDDATVSHKSIQLSEVGGKESVDTLSVK